MSMTSAQNVFHLTFGSVPIRSNTSCGASGRRAATKEFVGHEIFRVIPSTSSTVGRTAWKS
jgi:hypothetical protein